MKSLFGGAHLKRVSISIQYKNKPENVVIGYALSHEILPGQLSFFAAQKFPVDEELIISFMQNGEKKSYVVMMKHMHEQISSGRIMNSLPNEENPFPARKFYRCYSSVMGAAIIEKPVTAENSFSEEKPIQASINEMKVATTDAEAQISNIFAAEAVDSAVIPDVDEGLKAA